MLKNISKIVSVIFFAGILVLFTGCTNSDDPIATEAITAIDLEKITPQDIVDGKIDVADLDEAQKFKLLSGDFGEEFSKSDFESWWHFRALIINSLNSSEIYNELKRMDDNDGTFSTEEEIWTAVHSLKEGAKSFLNESSIEAGVYDFKNSEKNEWEKIVVEKAEESLRENGLESLFNSSSQLKSSGCPIYNFPYNGVKANSYNTNCFSVVNADNKADWQPCDYMACFYGYSNFLYADSSNLNSLIVNGFGGYQNMIIRKKWFKTYVLLGSIRSHWYIFGTPSQVKNHIKTNLKLKV